MSIQRTDMRNMPSIDYQMIPGALAPKKESKVTSQSRQTSMYFLYVPFVASQSVHFHSPGAKLSERSAG